jgi:hypothetical protein
MKITMTLEQFKAISRLADFANYYIDGLEPSGEQYNSDLEDVERGRWALSAVNKQIQFS